MLTLHISTPFKFTLSLLPLMPSTAFHVIQIFKLILLNPPTPPKKKHCSFFRTDCRDPKFSIAWFFWSDLRRTTIAHFQPERSAERNQLQIKITHPYSAHIWLAKINYFETMQLLVIFRQYTNSVIGIYHFFKLIGQLSVSYTNTSPTYSPTRNLYGPFP